MGWVRETNKKTELKWMLSVECYPSSSFGEVNLGGGKKEKRGEGEKE